MPETILIDARDGVATLTLNRPDKLNSFNVKLHQELAAALGDIEKDASVRAVLVTGAGRGFCAGQDLADRAVSTAAEKPDLGASLDRYYNPLIRRMRALPKPIVCAVNGVAAGAGANFALACDIVLAARSASFIQAFVKIGLVQDCGGSFFLPRLLGTARAMALAMLGDKVTAEQAEQWGMIWRAVDDARLMDEATALAHQLADGPTHTLGLIKHMVYASGGNDLATQLDLERDMQREAGSSGDYREGVTAFLEKRPANFRGK